MTDTPDTTQPPAATAGATAQPTESWATIALVAVLASALRGIALQTVIVMVVLLAIAGGVAAVLLTSGGEAVDDLENQQVTRQAGDYTNKTLCEAAGFSWSSSNASVSVCVTTT